MPALPPEPPGRGRAPHARPLPDPASIQLCRIPDPAPPYDAATPPTPDMPNPGGTHCPHQAERGTSLAPEASPEAAAVWPSRFAQVLAETLAGSRPPRQIAPWTTEQARTHIRRLGAQLACPQQPQVRRVVASRPACGVVEMTVVVGFGPRVRALAVRLEEADAALAAVSGDGPGHRAAPGSDRPGPGRWLCTAVEAA
ncbi:MAG TPA: Rv3235 family protein [Streptosporangiaceae bacterium]|nr:Rv3235 family protein [Streptosporangiaceae bacterium]